MQPAWSRATRLGPVRSPEADTVLPHVDNAYVAIGVTCAGEWFWQWCVTVPMFGPTPITPYIRMDN